MTEAAGWFEEPELKQRTVLEVRQLSQPGFLADGHASYVAVNVTSAISTDAGSSNAVACGKTMTREYLGVK